MSETKFPERIPMRELKAGLSRYIAKARAGDAFEVTLHDKPVARIIGIPAFSVAGVSRLVASGAAHWGGGKPSLRAAIRLESEGTTLSAAVLEDRG